MALEESIAALKQALAGVRPGDGLTRQEQGEQVNRQLLALGQDAQLLERLRAAARHLLAMPGQQAFFAEAGLHSAKGFALELGTRIGQRVLPLPPEGGSYADVVHRAFVAQDHHWLALVTDDTWAHLLGAVAPGPDDEAYGVTRASLAEAARMLSYRLAGCALDRELLQADAALERHESPFLALNALVVPWLDRMRAADSLVTHEEGRDAEVLLAQCEAALARVRRRLREIGVSIRLTYLIARMDQLVARLRVVLAALTEQASAATAVVLLRETIASENRRHEVRRYIGETVSLLARNVTDHAARHGEHYIAQDRSQWLHMARAAAGGGVVIACMALAKLQLGLLHLPPLTAGIVYGLNYGLGFVLIHMLGFVVATKQPAMTAAAIAATLEDTQDKRRIERLADLAQNTVRTQFVAVLGNVGLALPLACLIALAWTPLTGSPIAPPDKLHKMLAEIIRWPAGRFFSRRWPVSGCSCRASSRATSTTRRATSSWATAWRARRALPGSGANVPAGLAPTSTRTTARSWATSSSACTWASSARWACSRACRSTSATWRSPAPTSARRSWGWAGRRRARCCPGRLQAWPASRPSTWR